MYFNMTHSAMGIFISLLPMNDYLFFIGKHSLLVGIENGMVCSEISASKMLWISLMVLAGTVGPIGMAVPVLQAENLADSLDMPGGFRTGCHFSFSSRDICPIFLIY